MAKKDKKIEDQSQARTTVSSRPKAKESSKENSTTVTSAPVAKADIPKADTTPVAPVVMMTPQQNSLAGDVAKLDDNAQMHRDRRAQNENRRGRFAEKTPAGTRTKMLKIIYDKRADMVARKKSRRRFQIIAGLITVLFISGSLYQGAVVIREQMDPLIHQAERWWEKVVTPATPTQNRQSNSVAPDTRNIAQQRKSSISVAPKPKKQKVTKQSKRTKKAPPRKVAH